MIQTKDSPTPAVIRVVIADDHELLRSGLQKLIECQSGIKTVGLAANGVEAVRLCQELRPDLVLLDLRMPQLDGLSATRLIKQVDPDIVIIAVTIYEDFQYVVKAIEAGASGYLLKDASQLDILRAIRRAMANQTTLSPKLVQHLMCRLSHTGRKLHRGSGRLTVREREILGLIAEGNSNRQIAVRLGVTEGTVNSHARNIYSRLDVSDRTEAVVKAIQLGLVRSRIT